MPTPDPTAGPDRGPIDAAWLLDRTETLCRADTTTGREDHGLPLLRTMLKELGAAVELQQVAPDRHNVLATWGKPRLLFSTHLDTVPPFLPPRRSGDLLSGRGTCDAKGQAVAQFGAIQRLLAKGLGGFAWLGVVGEETDSIGAAAATSLAKHFVDCVAVLNGEPTENKLATGQRGSLRVRLATKGKAAHSGMPELGHSAAWPLLDWLQRLRQLPVPSDADLGDEIWNLGTLRGGVAANVIPPDAEAELFVRSIPDSRFLEVAKELAPPEGLLETISYSPPEKFGRVPGFEHAVVPFGSDAPKMRSVVGGQRVVLCGPGTIKVAHTLDEHITGDDLVRGCDLLVEIAQSLLGGGGR